ncbi:MAG TPA: DUF1499 domain-containing protein, partial [Nostocaceae cyanobacterium]|nr:DUF1499 domain-containing protein [Nostocaceae cyanobacterium]
SSLLRVPFSPKVSSQLRSDCYSDYLHVDFKSALMGFVDDVEFYLDRNNNLIHLHSASRLGYSNLGVNRQQITTIRHLFI